MRKWVVDASPVILLARIDHVALLTDLSDELMIPASVADEIAAGPADDPARRWLRSPARTLIDAAVTIAPEVAGFDLGRGESAVLSWAYSQSGWVAVIDDRAARRCAETLGIPTTGTVGILLAAKHEGMIDKVEHLLDRLVKSGLRLSDALIAEALRLAGES